MCFSSDSCRAFLSEECVSLLTHLVSYAEGSVDSHVLSLSVSRRFSVRSPSWSRLRPAKRRGRSKDATFGAPGIATRNQDATFGAPGLTTSNKKL